MIITIGGIIILGIACQWLSWKLKIPVIITLLMSGMIAGPLLGILNPREYIDSESMFTIIEFAVALILFDGAMQLKFAEFKSVADGLKRILTIGVLIHFVLLSIAAYFLVIDSFICAALVGGILIVTGPTVVIPALREAKVEKKISHYLKWEGIVTDPIGAILAIVIYDAIILSRTDDTTQITVSILKIIMIAGITSFVLNEVVKFAFSNNRMPQYLKLPFVTSIVLSSFAFSNEIQHGTGLLTVTILGMLIGNSKLDNLLDIQEFKENITTMCISFVFIIITASTSFESFSMISFSQAFFIILAAFVLRPMAILISTYKSKMNFREKFLIGAFGPRGIVAVSVAAALSTEMKEKGLSEFGETLLPVILLVVITTVIFHSLYLPFLSKKLELESIGGNGVVIIGTMPWVLDLSKKLREIDIPVLVTSASWYKLAPYRKSGISTFYGQILDHLDTIDLSDYGSLLAMSENDAFNMLSCDRFSKLLGHENVYKLKQAKNFVHDKYNIDKKSYCVYLNNLDLRFENFVKYYQYGWRFKYTRLTDNFSYQDFLLQNDRAIICMKITPEGRVIFGSHFLEEPKSGDTVISFVSKKYETTITNYVA